MVRFSAILPNFTGTIINSGRLRLRLVEILGTGAHGVVYCAHDLSSPPENPTCYAVKCLLRQSENSDHHDLQRREIAYHTAVSSHLSVVRLHDVIEDEFYIYLVLDHCPGGDLFSAIIDRKVYQNDDALLKETYLQLLDAVHSCHDVGVFHRDLKPENILCSEDGGHIYLADFGLSTRARISMMHGCGSSFYMSPECVGTYTNKHPFITSVSDIWSLGVILANMITGCNPWHIACPIQDLGFRDYLNEGEPWLRRMMRISPAASKLLAYVLAPIPESRISMHELRKAIIEIDTFFPDPEEDVDVGNVPRMSSTAPVSVDITDCRHSQLFSGTASDMEFIEIYPLPSPIPLTHSRVEAANFSVPLIAAFPTPKDAGDSTLVHVSSCWPSDASRSSSDSRGPVTPETFPITFSNSVPDLHLDFPGVPDPIAVGPVDLECDIADSTILLTMKKRKLPRSWERIVGAVQRIKVNI